MSRKFDIDFDPDTGDVTMLSGNGGTWYERDEATGQYYVCASDGRPRCLLRGFPPENMQEFDHVQLFWNPKDNCYDVRRIIRRIGATMIEPLSQLVPPPPGNWGGTATASDYPDHIQQLGDTIANLTLGQAAELSDYLRTKEEVPNE